MRRISYTGNPGNTPPDRGGDGDAPVRQPAAARWTSTGPSRAIRTPATRSPTRGTSTTTDSSTTRPASRPRFTYTTPGVYTVTLRVTDTSGAFDEDTVTINAGSGPPVPTIDTPAAGTTWGVGQIDRASRGSATDPEDGTLPGTALDWQLIMHHCTVTRATATSTRIQSFENTASGTFAAPDHEYPSHLELKLTATDSRQQHGHRLAPARPADGQSSRPPATRRD